MNDNLLKKLIIVLMFINFLLISFHRLNRRNNSENLDQGAYLKLGIMIKEGTAMTDSNRHPLYPYILSFFAERKTEYFITGKLLTLGMGFIILLIIFFKVKKTWGLFIASITLLLIIPAFIEMSSGILCESIVTLCFFFAWITIVKGFEDYKYWILAGIFSGLSLLTKGSANLIVITFAITLISTNILTKKINYKSILLSPAYVLSYLLTALPLLLYNFNKYGEPFFNINTKYIMWLDKWEDYYRIKTPLPVLKTYMASHTLTDMFIREIRGFPKAPGAGILLIFLIIFGIMPFFKLRYFEKYKNNMATIIFSVSIIFLHYILFSWYVPIASGSRFVFPLYPMIFILLLDFILFYYADVMKSFAAKCLPAIAIVLFIGVIGEIAFLNLNNPYKNEIYTFANVEKWLNETSDQQEKILYGPSSALPEWRISSAKEFIPIPLDVDINELEEYAKKNQIKYFILDLEIFNRRPQLLSSVAIYNKEQGLILNNVPKTWSIIMEDEKRPKKYYVIKFI
ncbi:glycosyltransferase family 39 protein [Candidatus Poribacteria bacterium]|nr:glycosyltransferase family 39 protein [Candidatus Poribacteria bacterium]